jgi:carbon-monoxide dehydrogenase medium subunit
MTTAPLPLTVTERSQMRVLSADGPEAAWQLARRHRAPLVAGATGVQPVWERQARWPACVVPLSADWPGFAGVTVTGDRLDIGALTPLASLAGAPALARRLPSLAPFMDRVASPGVRQLATLGGNLVAGGDLSALALVLEAELRVFSGAGWHHLPLSAWPGWVRREPGALIRSVHLSIPRGCPVVLEKLGHRERFSPPRITVACARLGTDVRVAVSGEGGPVRLAALEARLARAGGQASAADGEQALAELDWGNPGLRAAGGRLIAHLLGRLTT